MFFGKEKMRVNRNWRLPVLLIALILVFCGCGQEMVLTDDVTLHSARSIADETSENNRYILYSGPGEQEFCITDSNTGYKWSTQVSDEYYGETIMNRKLSGGMKALFNFKYTDFSDKIVVTNSVNEESEITVTDIAGGQRYEYRFVDIGITIVIELTMANNALEVRIPIQKIKEEPVTDSFTNETRTYGVVGIDVLPFLSAAKSSEDGYMFYPDGSGALCKFDENKTDATVNILPVYGSSEISFSRYEDEKTQGIHNACLPVFGLKSGTKAFLGVITEGDSFSSINVCESGYIYKVNRIYPTFAVRRAYSFLSREGDELSDVSKEKNTTDFAIRYMFLSDNEADYSGMANAYREYLIRTGALKMRADTEIPLNIDLFIGSTESRILLDKRISVTTFSQAVEILKAYREEGVSSIQINLVGWQKGGYPRNPVSFLPEGLAGSEKGLADFIEYCKESGISVCLQNDFLNAGANSGGFSKRNDVVHDILDLAVSNETNDKFLFKPASSIRFLREQLGKMSELGVSGVTFEALGDMLYGDYNPNTPSNPDATRISWETMLALSKKRLGTARVTGANGYVIPYVDTIINLPETDSGYKFTDEAIPFYQMVIHGSITYCGQPANQSYDMQLKKLKWIEYGYAPYFVLTYDNSSLLKNSEYSELFSTFYKDWVSLSGGMVKEFSKSLGATWNQAIVRHRQAAGNVYVTEYSNGTKIYVNYNDAEVTVEGCMVPARDYAVVK